MKNPPHPLAPNNPMDAQTAFLKCGSMCLSCWKPLKLENLCSEGADGWWIHPLGISCTECRDEHGLQDFLEKHFSERLAS